jgi:hypothetical protein
MFNYSAKTISRSNSDHSVFGRVVQKGTGARPAIVHQLPMADECFAPLAINNKEVKLKRTYPIK